MKVKELMDKKFIVVGPDADLDEVSEKMETHKRFTIPIVDEEKKLIGWITSLNVIRGLREGKRKYPRSCTYQRRSYTSMRMTRQDYSLKNLKTQSC